MKYQLANFEIDTTLFQIFSNGEVIPAEPKVFDLIVYLIKNRHRLVTRDELFDIIWAGREVSDTTLSNHIKSARKIFNDNGDQQNVIKTLRGRGYQFVAYVEEKSISYPLFNEHMDNQTAAPPVEPQQFPGIITSSVSRLVLASVSGATLLFIVLLALFLWHQQKANLSEAYSDSKPYILVVPFEVSAVNAEKWTPFADQVTREVILKMRKISGLRVVPASSAFRFKQNKSRDNIIDKLPELRYLLDAVVSIEDSGKIQITVQLENMSNGKLVWDNHYLSYIDNTNFFSVQAEIATAVSKSLEVIVLKNEIQALRAFKTHDLAAYELYVSGQHHANLLTHDSLLKSIKLFNNATTLDPNFEAAYLAKADAYRILMTYFEKPINTLPYVIESALAALELNPESAEAYSSLGLAYAFTWRWDDAWEMLNLAREKDPNLALTELGFAIYYTGIGDQAGVHESLALASQLDPLNIEVADWGQWLLAMVGDARAAGSWAAEKIRLYPNVGIIHSGASVSASMRQEYQKAVSYAEQGVFLEPNSPLAILILAQAYGYSGQLEKARILLTKAESISNYTCPYEAAIVYLLLDQKEQAFNLLHEAVDYRSNCLVFTRYDPRLTSLRSDPRYDALLERVGLDDKSLGSYTRYRQSKPDKN